MPYNTSRRKEPPEIAAVARGPSTVAQTTAGATKLRVSRCLTVKINRPRSAPRRCRVETFSRAFYQRRRFPRRRRRQRGPIIDSGPGCRRLPSHRSCLSAVAHRRKHISSAWAACVGGQLGANGCEIRQGAPSRRPTSLRRAADGLHLGRRCQGGPCLA